MLHTLPRNDSERMVYIQRMTNWERCQWAKAGYPHDITSFGGARISRMMRYLEEVAQLRPSQKEPQP